MANMMAYPELRNPFEATPIQPAGSKTVLYPGHRITLDVTGPGDGLLINPDDLPRINGFTLKPEGACLEDTCIPLPPSVWQEVEGQRWFDLLAFADHIGQAYVSDAEHQVYSFAEVPSKRDALLQDAMAPDFAITDRQGNVITRADLKGKKALIVTWSSW